MRLVVKVFFVLLVAEANQKFESKSQLFQEWNRQVVALLVAEANQKFESKSQLYVV